MSALEMASKLNKLGIDSGGNTKRNIEVNAQKKDIKGVYIAGKGRGVTYTINITGKNLAKEWLREILHIQ